MPAFNANHIRQVETVIAGAKTANKVGAIIENWKEEEFLRRLRAALPAESFKITVLGSIVTGKDLKTVIIEKITPVDPSRN